MTCRECGFPQDHPRHDLSRVGHWMLAHPFVPEDVPAAHAPAEPNEHPEMVTLRAQLAAASDLIRQLEQRREADRAEFSKREKAYQTEIASLLGRLADTLEAKS
jgi:hypothetical protein